MKDKALKQAAQQMMSQLENLDMDKVHCIKIAIMMRPKDEDADEGYEEMEEEETSETKEVTKDNLPEKEEEED